MAFADRLQHAGMTIVPDDAGTWVVRMRLVKWPDEIAAMRRAAALADAAVPAIAAALWHGGSRKIAKSSTAFTSGIQCLALAAC